jgi:hypothetical protein
MHKAALVALSLAMATCGLTAQAQQMPAEFAKIDQRPL